MRRTKTVLGAGCAALALGACLGTALSTRLALAAQFCLSSLSAHISFPLADAALLLLVGSALFFLAGAIPDALRGRLGPLRRTASAIARTVLLLALGCLLLWQPLAGRARIACAPRASTQTMEALIATLGRRATSLWTNDFPAPEEAVRLAERALRRETGRRVRVKPSGLSGLMTYLNLAGLYVPFTGESLLNERLMPLAMPFVAAHEGAHQLGYGDEAEASFIAYRALSAYGGPAAYSATAFMLYYADRALRALDAQAWTACRSRLDPRVLRDIRRIALSQSAAHDNEPGFFARCVPSDAAYARVTDYLLSMYA